MRAIGWPCPPSSARIRPSGAESHTAMRDVRKKRERWWHAKGSQGKGTTTRERAMGERGENATACAAEERGDAAREGEEGEEEARRGRGGGAQREKREIPRRRLKMSRAPSRRGAASLGEGEVAGWSGGGGARQVRGVVRVSNPSSPLYRAFFFWGGGKGEGGWDSPLIGLQFDGLSL